MNAYIFKIVGCVGLVFSENEIDLFCAIDRHVNPFECEYMKIDDSTLYNTSFLGKKLDIDSDILDDGNDIEGNIMFNLSVLASSSAEEWLTFDHDDLVKYYK